MNTSKRLPICLLMTLTLSACQAAEEALTQIRVPPGFRITLFTDQTPGARQMALGDDGTVYVGSRGAGNVYAVSDQDGDGLGERVRVVAADLNEPNGVAFWKGDLYIAEIHRISKLENISQRRESPPSPAVVYDGYPNETHHGWKYLGVGPDGKLYVPVGAPCNICLPEQEIFATLTRLDPDGKNREIFARGIRNTVGFDWQPDTGELWFTDNGRDWLGDDTPPEELNHAPAPGMHFGYPYCHAGEIPDPEYGRRKPCRAFTAPAWKFAAHTAALGMRFYTGQAFPEEYRKSLFVAQHGSWNRTRPQGYRVVAVQFRDGQPVGEKVFAEGWLQDDGKVLGRPVDVLPLADGSLLVSDDRQGAIYRIHYDPEATKGAH